MLSRITPFYCAMLLALPLSQAKAHVPYLAPASFEPVRGWVTLEASFADRLFQPEAKFDQSQFVVQTPDGSSRAPAELVSVRSRTVLDDELTTEGTYKYSTGQRFGAVFHSYELNGKTENSRDPNFVLPKGATLKAHFQSVTQAQTFISKGKPTDNVLKASGQGLEVEFISHPNDLFAGQPISGRLLLNGKPVANNPIELHRTGKGTDSEKSAPLQSNTDANGQFSLQPAAGGVYLLLARHRAPAPAGAKAPVYSYTSTTVLETVE
jgi:hypothetical protein